MNFQKCHNQGVDSAAAFTLVEIMVAISLLALLSASAIIALSQANQNAAVARLNTGAQVAAQNEIDMIMSRGPFNPQHKVLGVSSPQIPAELILGTHAYKPVTVYTEPAAASNNWAPLVVTGQLSTTVIDTAKVVSGRNLNMYSAMVTVTYAFRGKSRQVQLNAMRASDIDGTF